MSVFYESYGTSKDYSTPQLNRKHIARFDAEIWRPARLEQDMRCLEIGCGTGHFLGYLQHKGISDLKAIDLDASLADVIPEAVRGNFEACDVRAFMEKAKSQPPYDRIFMFDVFEHFKPEDGLKLLKNISAILKPDGMIVLKMPNAASPWGGQFQHGDLTHLAAYTPDSIRQMAVAAGMTCTSCYPHLLGSPRRRYTDRIVQAVLNKLLATPPEIWEGNFYAILVPDGTPAQPS